MSGSFWRRRAAQQPAPTCETEQPELEEAAAEQEPVTQSRPRHGAGGWRSLVEQRIQEGIERGLFDNLAGMGQPLNLHDDALVPEDMRMAFRLLRANGLAPLWVELNKEIRQDIDRLQRFRELVHERVERGNVIQWQHRRREYIDRVADINAKIRNYNILAPSSQVHLHILILEDELARFDSL